MVYMDFPSLFKLEKCFYWELYKKSIIYIQKYKIRKDWSLLYFAIRTDRSLPKFGKFGEIGALNSERLKHPPLLGVETPLAGPGNLRQIQNIH